MRVYQEGAGIQFDTQLLKQCQTPGDCFGIPIEIISYICLYERWRLRVVDDRKNHPEFHAVVVMFVS